MLGGGAAVGGGGAAEGGHGNGARGGVFSSTLTLSAEGRLPSIGREAGGDGGDCSGSGGRGRKGRGSGRAAAVAGGCLSGERRCGEVTGGAVRGGVGRGGGEDRDGGVDTRVGGERGGDRIRWFTTLVGFGGGGGARGAGGGGLPFTALLPSDTSTGATVSKTLMEDRDGERRCGDLRVNIEA